MIVSRNWLQTYFEQPLPPAAELADLLTFHTFEVEGVDTGDRDATIKIDVLPNRSSDCLCHRGVARELGTLLERPLNKDPLRDSLPTYPSPQYFRVEVEDTEFCPRYIGAIVRGVTVGPSPSWLAEALQSVGQRPINNIVDATNYVMLNIGQPLHAFDYHKLAVSNENVRVINVRSAVKDEPVVLLGGEERTLKTHHHVIADGASDATLAIAGVKGGVRAEVSPDTTDIILEAAHFNPQMVRTAAQELKLVTDASLRFQNEPVIELPAFAMRDLITLIMDVAGGELVGVVDTYTGVHERMPIDVPLSRINHLLGTTLTTQDVENILVRLEWEFSLDKEEFAVTPPWERTDISLVADVVEEIGRIYGLRTIQSRLPKPLSRTPTVSPTQYYSDLIRHTLVDRGYSEVLTYTLTDTGDVELANPYTSDKSHLRRELRNGIQHALDDNTPRAPLLGLGALTLFELGTCFVDEREELHLALGVRAVQGKQSKAETTLAEDVARVSAKLGAPLQAKPENGIVEFRIDSLIAELPKPEIYDEPLPWNSDARYTAWSAYPYVLRDIAVWVPSNMPAEEVLAVILVTAPELLVRHDLFDTFEKDGRTSYAYHLVYQATDRTLTDAEVNSIMNAIELAMRSKGWEVR